MRTGFLVVDAELFEQAQDDSSPAPLRSAASSIAQLVGIAPARTGEFQQAVAAAVDEGGEFLGGSRLADQRIEFGVGRPPPWACCSARATTAAIALDQFAAIRRARAGRYRDPGRTSVAGRAGRCRKRAGVDLMSCLADAVEAADALFEQIRVERQIPEDEVAGELEVAALRADLGAQQQARTIGFGEPGGIAVALHEVHAFVEAGDLDAAARAQGVLEGEHLGLGAADQQQLVLAEALEQVEQPRQARRRRRRCRLR